VLCAKSKFAKEYSDAIFIQIDQHLKKVIAKIQRDPDFLNHGVDRL